MQFDFFGQICGTVTLGESFPTNDHTVSHYSTEHTAHRHASRTAAAAGATQNTMNKENELVLVARGFCASQYTPNSVFSGSLPIADRIDKNINVSNASQQGIQLQTQQAQYQQQHENQQNKQNQQKLPLSTPTGQ